MVKIGSGTAKILSLCGGWCKVIFMSTPTFVLLGWVELWLSWGCAKKIHCLIIFVLYAIIIIISIFEKIIQPTLQTCLIVIRIPQPKLVYKKIFTLKKYQQNNKDTRTTPTHYQFLITKRTSSICWWMNSSFQFLKCKVCPISKLFFLSALYSNF